MADPASVLLSGIVGSTAYGLAGAGSDIDRLGVYAEPTAAFHGLFPPTERALSTVTTKPDIALHEAAKYARLCLKVNPSVTELMWLPDELYETRTAVGDQLIAIRSAFLSAPRVRDAYLGYAVSQFRRLEARGDGSFSADTRKRTAKHARHLARLIWQGLQLYRTGELEVRVPNPEWYRTFGDRVAAGDLKEARFLLAEAEADFAAARSPLPDEPDHGPIEEWLSAVRAAHYPPPEGPCPHLAEVRRLQEGGDATPPLPGVEYTPGQWLHRFNSLTPPDRLARVEAILRHSRRVSACEFMEDHRGQLAMYREQLQALLEERTRLVTALSDLADQKITFGDVRAILDQRPDRGLFLVDIDGTVALRDHGRPDVRTPFEWPRVGEDLPNEPVITVVQALAAAGHRIIYVSGRSEECRGATGVWIAEHIGVPGESLLMRAAGDYRQDAIVKRELYEKWVRPVGPVTAVLDDRAQVVEMWRDLGLTVLQCDEGTF